MPQFIALLTTTCVHGAVFPARPEVHVVPLVEELVVHRQHGAVGTHVGRVDVPGRGGDGLLRAALEVGPVGGVEETKIALIAHNVTAFLLKITTHILWNIFSFM